MSVILAAADQSFREHASGRLLEADYPDMQIAEHPGSLGELLLQSREATVITGGIWRAAQPFVRVAADAGAWPLVLLRAVSADIEREALATGARACLPFDIGARPLAAAIMAIEAGLIVLSPAASSPRLLSLSTRRGGRPLTTREREILSLVAAGTSNKAIGRALSVSANTVKFHLAAVFDKLDAATRAEAVAEAIRRGELSL